MLRKSLGAAILLLVVSLSAQAVITRLYPLKDMLGDVEFIFTAKVETLYPDKPAAVFTVVDDLKGKFPFRRLPANLSGDSLAKKDKQTPQLLKRLAPNLPVLFFVTEQGSRRILFAYTNGTWFHLITPKNAENPVLAFAHCEPFLRRTFKGSTAELKQIVIDGLAGKKEPPEPDPKEPPGLGPEVEGVKSGARTTHDGGVLACRFALAPSHPITGVTRRDDASTLAYRPPLFAVIPTLGIGGPLAILALLFPSIFGGVLVLFRHWLAFFTVLGMNTTLLFLHSWFAGSYLGDWWTSQTALWSTMFLLTLLGTLWAWRRQVRRLHDSPQQETPRRTEMTVLLVLSASCLAAAAWRDPEPNTVWWLLFASYTTGVVLTTILRLLYVVCSADLAKPRLSTEGVILGTTLVATMLITAVELEIGARPIDAQASSEGRPIAKYESYKPVFLDQLASGLIVSSPRVHGDHVFIAAAHRKLATFGALYCIDRHTLKPVWTFDADGDMKQVYSSPCIADGRVYIGEGFHDDVDCKLYCVDAKTGKKVWDFPTGGQTESSPSVAHGRVYFGAGNEGVYALDALTGKTIWRFPEDTGQGPLLRVGASPVVVGDRLYVGSGVDRNRPDDPGETAVFCLDAHTGKLLWKVKTDLPCWAAPVVAGNHVFFGLGNGDVFTDASTPAGAMLCLESDTGKEVWRHNVPNAVLNQPALDRQRIFFGSRDGHCYCVGRLDGKERWKADLGSPLVASPTADAGASDGLANTVFVLATAGQLRCLDAATGKVHWAFDKLTKYAPHLSSSPCLVIEPTAAGERRAIYFGAGLNNLALPALYRVDDSLAD